MATFTSTADLDMTWEMCPCVGPAGTPHRIPDSLAEEFEERFGGVVPGFQWVVYDEIAEMGGDPAA